MEWVALLRSWVRLPVGANFRLGLKKFPRLSHAKAYGKARLISRAMGPYVWVGQGFGGFLDLCEKVLPSTGRVFE
jgi:hypothetical protein